MSLKQIIFCEMYADVCSWNHCFEFFDLQLIIKVKQHFFLVEYTLLDTSDIYKVAHIVINMILM